MARNIKQSILVSLVAILISGVITLGLAMNIPMPLLETQKANAAFSSFRGMMGAAGTSPGVAETPTSYLFDGTDDFLTTPDHPNWDFTDQDQGTWEFWAKLASGASGEQWFITHFEDASNQMYMRYEVGVGFTFAANSTSTNFAVQTGDIMTDNDWHHYKITKNSSDKYTFYLDGVDSGDTTNAGNDTYAATLYIGQRGNSTGFFDGNIDDIRISDVDRGSGAPSAQHEDDANTLLLVRCSETIVTGETGSGATFVDTSGVHTITENAAAIRDTVVFKF